MSLPVIALGVEGWCLRPWADADAPALAKHANNREVWRFMAEGFPHPYTLDIAEHWVRRGHVEFGGDHWAISVDGEAVGGCGVRPDCGPFRCNAEIGYWLAEPHWGRGIGRRAARAMAEQAFAKPGITRVYAGVHGDNPRSMRVLESVGFVRECVLRRSAVKDGRVIDRVLYASVRDDAPCP